MSDDNDFEGDMEQLAAEIAIKAGAADVSLHDQIDAFKALMPYLALLKKGKKGDEENDEDMPNFGSFQKKIHSVK
jgi:hypothetical protein